MKQPPKYPLRFFRWFCHPDYVEDIEGDLMERFEKRPSRWRFTWEVLKLLRPGIVKRFDGTYRMNHYGMLKHYLKISYRNLIRRKSITLLNIGGLVMGLTIAMLIGLWIESELSFNKQNENYDRVAMVRVQENINGNIENSVSVPYPLHLALKNEYADDFEHVIYSTWLGNMVVTYDEKAITAKGGFMDVGAPDLLSLSMVKGNRNSLSEMGSGLISESLAKALFGDQDPIGKTVKAKRNWYVTVRGVFKDIPSNSSFHGVNFIGDWDFYESSISWRDHKTNWGSFTNRLYVVLKPDVNLDNVNKKVKRIIHNNLSEKDKIYDTKVFLHPMRDWHLRSNWENGIQTGGDIQYVWWFGIIGGFVLLLACVNYMNLSTAQSIRRAKEVGIRKSIGTTRRQLIAQFLTESILTVFISFVFASALAFLSLPFFNFLINKQISFPLNSLQFWASGVGFALSIGLVSGSYPAFYLSTFSAIRVLKGTYHNTLSAVFFRKSLVVFQFTIAVILIIGTLIVSQQINHASNRPLGYDQSGIVSISMHAVEHWSTNDAFRNDLLASGLITHFTQSSAPLTGIWTESGNISWDGMDTGLQPQLCTFIVNHNFGQTIDWEIIEGRDFSEELNSDSAAIIVNEAAVEYMQLTDPLETSIKWSNKSRIIGVVKNFLMESPFSEVRPTIYAVSPVELRNFQILRLNPKIPVLDAISGIEEIHKKHLHNVPFSIDFISDLHNKKFKKIEQLANISHVFALLAILISSLGIFGLAAYMVEQRTKEIGIRKVLGASIYNIWKLLSIEFVLLVLISCLFALPIAYYLISNWLEQYEYRIQIQGWVLIASCFGALFITLSIVSVKSFSAALVNPVDSLRDE